MLSIVTPAFNCEKTINQVYQNVKSLLSERIIWIVVDDCSTDNTLSFLRDIEKKDPFVIVFSLDSNSGPNKARRAGVLNSENKLIFFLDADDYIYKNNFFDFVDFSIKNDGYDFYFAPIHGVRKKSDFSQSDFFLGENVTSVLKPTDFIKYGFPQPSSLLVKKDSFLKNDVESDLKWGEDFLTYLCLSSNGTGIRWCKPTSCYIISGQGRGSNLSLGLRLELSKVLLIYTIENKRKILSSFQYICYLTVRHIFSYFYKKIKSKYY